MDSLALALPRFPFQQEEAMPRHHQKVLHEDLSGGQEDHPVSAINEYSRDKLKPFTYIRHMRVAADAVGTLAKNEQPCACRSECGRKESVCSCNQRYHVPRRFHSGTCNERCACNDRPGRLVHRDLGAKLATVYIEECSDACRCPPEKCRNRVVQEGPKREFQVFYTGPERGWGLRAKKFIAKDEFVVEYVGVLTRAKEDVNDDYIMHTEIEGTDYCIDAGEEGNAARFINHACVPNVFPVRVVWGEKRTPHVAFFALRDIDVDEEIVSDYGQAWWEAKQRRQDDFYCFCNDDECRYAPTQYIVYA